MKHFFVLSGFLVAAALLAPVGATAEDKHDKRYYDKNSKDYHVYNNQEDRAYRMYLEEHHRPYQVFGKTKAAEQQQYFKWRHEHSDSVLKIEVR